MRRKLEETMEISEIPEVGGLVELPRPQSLTIAVAIKGNRKGKHVVKWAVDTFVPEGEVIFKLIHVRPKIITVPTAMGNSIPISQVRDDIASAYKKEVEWQTYEMLLPYKRIFTRYKVQAEILQIESDDAISAISKEVAKSNFNKLVIGASSRGMFSRGRNASAKISENCPSFCTVYAVSKGKLSSLRPSDTETNVSIKDDTSESSFSPSNSLSFSSSFQAEVTPFLLSPSLPMQRFQALSSINKAVLHKTHSIKSNDSQLCSLNSPERVDITSSSTMSSSVGHSNSGESSFTSLVTENRLWVPDQPSTSDGRDQFSPSLADIDHELEKMRIELRHIKGMYAMAQSEATDASEKLNDLHLRRLEDASKLKEIQNREIKAKQLAIEEKVRYEAAKREAKYVRECAEREVAQRRDAETKASFEAKEKERLEKALVGPIQRYHKFEWEEIVSATSSFSENFKIGKGAFGTVYKCSLHHTVAAVKVLNCKEAHGTKQFQQELEILSKIRHPHLLILLGACPEQGCLVYEYMENGSLEDRLFRKNKTPPIPWFDRFRIAWEIASALFFLHNSTTQPIIHRDLKPANILLDRNYVSKIGDVGVSKMLNSDSFSTILNNTALVGTLCYIDPEYQRTGQISVQSDIYAFGMVVLQLLTGKTALALTHIAEVAVDDGRLEDVLDLGAGCWPIEETKELALLGLKCTELRRKDRPDMGEKVLPVLERLKEIANKAKDAAFVAKPVSLNHFLCPILKEIMEDPCVAADGHTYDRRAIEKWLKKKDKSPITNLPLLNKNLIPNYTLLSAINQWNLEKL